MDLTAFPFLSLLFLLPALINLGIAAYILFALPRIRTVDLFGICVLALCIWQIEEAGYMFLGSREAAFAWSKTFCFSWIMINPIALHFACSYTGRKFTEKRLFPVALYLPYLLLHGFYVASGNNNLQPDAAWGWVIAPGGSAIQAVTLWMMPFTMFVVIGMLLRMAFRLPRRSKERTQALVIAFGILIPTLIGFVTQVLFPLVFAIREMPLSPLLVTFFSLSTIVALRRFRLFDISEALQLETVLHQFHNIVLVVLPNRTVRSLNKFTTRIFGLEGGAYMPLERCFPTEEAATDFFEQVFEPAFEGHSLRNNMVSFRAGDRMIETLVAAEPVRHRNEASGVLIVASDITEYLHVVEARKEAEKQLEETRLQQHREITEAVLVAQENERRIIGAELHDNVNQILTSAKLYMGLAATEREGAPFLQQATGIIGVAMQEVRKLSHALIPPSWSGETLVEALRHLLSAAEQGKLFTVHLDVQRFEEERVSSKLKLTIYRIVQEQLNNIVKHAQAKTVRVSLRQDDALVLHITDDGIGFESESRSFGVGLRNMETRAQLHEGRLLLRSSPGKGCQLEVTFPSGQPPRSAGVLQ
ncbi:sensor histidine kinase [Flaviaesturariibacter flavus]|uniref:histidine kinase n=1 Tax=Flaviaesturariibacter flavus TaxID=2502780 RepID=A0A4R1BJA5_9BACT|nr:sensor histidine kinase [Flaviaesturariibacter flavus]TCJ17403.1 sensor histidine kinase [Flaviaesturariibacter flavus]